MIVFGPSAYTTEQDKLRLVLEHGSGGHFVVVKFFRSRPLTVKFWLKSYQTVQDAALHWQSTPHEVQLPLREVSRLLRLAHEAMAAFAICDPRDYL